MTLRDRRPVRHTYILDGHEPVPERDIMAWSRWFESADRHVRNTARDDVRVSTVFLGLDHGFGGRRELFETMLFVNGTAEGCERYSTWDEAEAGHQRWVACRCSRRPPYWPCRHQETNMDELRETIETIIELDEPEALLSTLRDAVDRRKGERWLRLKRILAEAEASMGRELEQVPVRGATDRATGDSQPQPVGADHAKHPDAAPEAAAATPAAPAAEA